MAEETKEPLGYALAIFVAFVALVAAANVVFGGPPDVVAEGRAVGGAVLLFVGAVTLVGLAAPLWLAGRGRLTLPVWPTPGTGDNALAVLLVVFLFARVEMLVAIFTEGRAWGAAAATFLGPAAIHLASVTATIGVLLPAFKKRMPVAPAAALASLAWVVYHAAQFHTFPEGRNISQLVVLAVFGLGYALYYFWSRSLFLTALLQHLVATTTFIYQGDYGSGSIDVPFYYSIVVVGAFLIFAAAKRRLYAAERFTHF
jgi:membrane protease YdiL (CAAX protease family)